MKGILALILCLVLGLPLNAADEFTYRAEKNGIDYSISGSMGDAFTFEGGAYTTGVFLEGTCKGQSFRIAGVPSKDRFTVTLSLDGKTLSTLTLGKKEDGDFAVLTDAEGNELFRLDAEVDLPEDCGSDSNHAKELLQLLEELLGITEQEESAS